MMGRGTAVEQTQVAIVGGGPVGLGLAIELGQRGVSTVVIEKAVSLHRIPKGQNLTQRTMEHFRSWGVEDEVRSVRVMPPGYPASGVNAYGNLMGDFAHPWFRRSQVADYYFAANERLPQYLTEQVLRRRVDQLTTVTGRFGTTATAVRQDESVVYVSTDGGALAAEYVVGCDGSHSMVRGAVGISEHRSEHDKRMVLLVFRSRELHRILEGRFGQASFFNVLHPDLDGYWRFLGRVDVGEGWFFHAPVPAGTTAEHFDAAALLHATVGVEFPIELDYLGFWDLRIAIADSYRRGRVFLAGDAAHSHPPYGGYGINTGFEDARNLGWKLAAAVAGWGSDALLTSYTDERRPVFASTARDFIEAFIENDRAFIAAHDPTADATGFVAAWERRRSGSHGVVDFEPHYEGSPIVFGPVGGTTSAVGSHTFLARPGHHLPPPGPGQGHDLFAALGSDFTLLAAESAAPAAQAFTAVAAALGVPLKVVGVGDAAAGTYGSTLILARPDHYVTWVDDGTPYEVDAVLGHSVGR